jgi:nuclear pore complex protein Nup85
LALAHCSSLQAQQNILGTAVGVVRETAEDLQAVLERVRREIEAEEERAAAAEAAGEEEGAEPQPWVHSGFLGAYDSLRPAVLSLLACLLGGEQERWRIFLTGHSLGGALATLCAWDCSHRT